MRKIEADIPTTSYGIFRTVSAMQGIYGGTDLIIQLGRCTEQAQESTAGQVVQLAKGVHIRRLPGGCTKCPLLIGRDICTEGMHENQIIRLKCEGFVYNDENVTANATLHCVRVAGGKVEPNSEVPDAAELAMNHGALCLKQSGPLFAGKDGKSSIKSHRPGRKN